MEGSEFSVRGLSRPAGFMFSSGRRGFNESLSGSHTPIFRYASLSRSVAFPSAATGIGARHADPRRQQRHVVLRPASSSSPLPRGRLFSPRAGPLRAARCGRQIARQRKPKRQFIVDADLRR
jgi:hypothetical protein